MTILARLSKGSAPEQFEKAQALMFLTLPGIPYTYASPNPQSATSTLLVMASS